MGEMTLLQSK
jgi:exportin-2 (importin alpha re-exporter)